MERQHALEEAYKMEISASHTADNRPVRMSEISPLWEEMAHKTWLLHTGLLAHKQREEEDWIFLFSKRCFHIFFSHVSSETQKKKAASSSQKRFDVISSVWSALGRLGKESLTVEVNTRSPYLLSTVGTIKRRVSLLSPCEECGVISFSQHPRHPSQSHCCVCSVGRPALWGCLIISLNGFGLSQLIAPEWA